MSSGAVTLGAIVDKLPMSEVACSHRERRGRLNVARLINSVQAMLLFNIGDGRISIGELTSRGCYLGSASPEKAALGGGILSSEYWRSCEPFEQCRPARIPPVSRLSGSTIS
jgi:hypothetical protein